MANTVTSVDSPSQPNNDINNSGVKRRVHTCGDIADEGYEKGESGHWPSQQTVCHLKVPVRFLTLKSPIHLLYWTRGHAKQAG